MFVNSAQNTLFPLVKIATEKQTYTIILNFFLFSACSRLQWSAVVQVVQVVQRPAVVCSGLQSFQWFRGLQWSKISEACRGLQRSAVVQVVQRPAVVCSRSGGSEVCSGLQWSAVVPVG